MHIRFNKHGQGRASKAVAYLLKDSDSKGRARDAVSILRGNPKHVAKLADSLSFKYKYSSATVAWAPEDQPTDQQIDEVLTDFERTAFAGLDADRYAMTAVRHDDGDSTHVHLIIARVDIDSGKSYNPAPPGKPSQHVTGWRARYDPLRDYYNNKYGWASPNDRSRWRHYVPPRYEQSQAAEARRDGRQLPSSNRQAISDWVTHLVETGAVRDRDGVKSSLEQIGTITREGRDYISVRPPDKKQAMRFSGKYFRADFNAERDYVAPEPAPPENNPEKAEAARQKWETKIERLAEYNISYYGPNQYQNRTNHSRFDKNSETPPENTPEFIATELSNERRKRTPAERDRADVAKWSGSDHAIDNRVDQRATPEHRADQSASRTARRAIVTSRLFVVRRLVSAMQRTAGHIRSALRSGLGAGSVRPGAYRYATAEPTLSHMPSRIFDERTRQTLLKFPQRAAISGERVHYLLGNQNLNEFPERADHGLHDVSTRWGRGRYEEGAGIETAGVNPFIREPGASQKPEKPDSEPPQKPPELDQSDNPNDDDSMGP